MPFINGGHLWLVLALVVLLVVFGPGRLPELGAAVGKTIKAFKRSTEELKTEMSQQDPEPETASNRIATVSSSSSTPASPDVSAETGRPEPARHRS